MGQNKPDWASRVAGNIRRLSKEAGLSQNKVAEIAGISRQTFSRKLGQKPETFNILELDNTAETLGVTVLDLLA